MQLKPSTRRIDAGDLPEISKLHARAFGPGRFARSAYRVREGKGLCSRFCRLAEADGRVVAAVRVTEIVIGEEGGAALLGPVAVDPDFRNQGHGRALIAEMLDELKGAGVKLVVLVGDQSYYGRFGFAPAPAGHIRFPGPVDPMRILALELKPGLLAAYRGVVAAAPTAAAAG